MTNLTIAVALSFKCNFASTKRYHIKIHMFHDTLKICEL